MHKNIFRLYTVQPDDALDASHQSSLMSLKNRTELLASFNPLEDLKAA
ncbi:hypothetical protein VRK_30780 [Vibrio sp. MEBiC08052]|nr:hypothetical protein VRK_30780 [Vibrio sp. MEBiC08052]